jgi:uncharacterized phiE125 gp8 family phage protein
MYPSTYGGPYGNLVTYGTLNLTDWSVLSPPSVQTFEEPLDLADVLTYLKLDAGDLDSEMVQADITAARSIAETLQGRDLVRKQWDLTRDYWPCGVGGVHRGAVELRPHLVAVDLVRRRDSNGAYTDLVENTEYVVDASKQPGLIVPPYNAWWPSYTPWPSSSLLIRFTCGLSLDSQFWSGPGQAVRAGMRRLISDWHSNRLPRVLQRGETLALPDPITSMLSFGSLKRVVR